MRQKFLKFVTRNEDDEQTEVATPNAETTETPSAEAGSETSAASAE